MPSTRSSNRAGGGLNLAALANPAPASTELPDDDFDPTGGALPRDANADSGDDDSGDGFSDDDVGAVDDGVLAPTEDDKGDKGGRLRMRGGLSLDELGAEYHGKRTSRKAMEEAWAGAEDPDAAEEDSEDDDDDDEDDDGMEGLDADDLARMEREAAEDDDGSDEDEEDIDEEDSDEDDDDDDSGADVDVDDDDESQEASDDDDDDGDDGGDLAAELAAFRREEAEANRLAAAKSQNAVKGAAVRRQNEMWEKALQTRIVLQRGLNASAKMPTPTYWRALAKADGEVDPAMATCAAAARGALDALCSLQAALIDGNPAIAEAAGEGVGGGKKRKASSAMAAVSKFGLLASPASEVWTNVDSVYQRFAAFRDVSIDRWHRKAQVQVGKMSAGGSVGGGEMRAFNQSVSAQVASAMRIPDRLVRKSQPPAHLAPKRLGEPEGTEKAAPTGDRTEDLDADDLEAAARAEARVEEIYDDADFYEQVLKEFLESAGAAAGLAAAASKPAKRRKVVDRRASKGRKLRYHVQQKLVNFCAPVELEVPQWAEKIFGQLFASSA